MKRGISKIVHTHGNLHEVIPAMVNQIGQLKAADRLGVSPHTVNRWLKENGYKLKRQYVREYQEGSAA
jgi:hypothetical protein